MKIFTTFAIAQLLLLATGSDVPGESKRVGCLYRACTRTESILFPEDIDPSICTHLVYSYGFINFDTEEIEIRTDIHSLQLDEDPEGIGPKILRLKDVNPDLKLILQIVRPSLNWVFTNSSRRENVIRNSVKWLKQNGFDGLDFPSQRLPPDAEEFADFLCDLKAEFNKYGYILAFSLMENLLPGASQQQRDSFRKMARCCDQITIETSVNERDGYRYAGIRDTRSMLDNFIEFGLPPNKIQITVAAVGTIFRIAPPNETTVVVNITGPENGTFNLKGGSLFFYKELLQKFNDSSLGWTFRREETKEPYAFSESGLWIAYEDLTSMKLKAHYALEKGIGGINIFALDLEDAEGIEGDGRFPFTRAIYNIFTSGNQSSHTLHN